MDNFFLELHNSESKCDKSSKKTTLMLLNLLERYHTSDRPLNTNFLLISMFQLFLCEKGISVLTRLLGQVSISKLSLHDHSADVWKISHVKQSNIGSFQSINLSSFFFQSLIIN